MTIQKTQNGAIPEIVREVPETTGFSDILMIE